MADHEFNETRVRAKRVQLRGTVPAGQSLYQQADVKAEMDKLCPVGESMPYVVTFFLRCPVA